MINGPQVNGDQFGVIELNITTEQNGTSEVHSPTEDEQKTEDATWTNEENGVAEVKENPEETPVVSENIPVEIAAAS